jgi:hypothetical protein
MEAKKDANERIVNAAREIFGVPPPERLAKQGAVGAEAVAPELEPTANAPAE